jgi:hypothetical protein
MSPTHTLTPISPPSGPSYWLFQGPPAESRLLAVKPKGQKGILLFACHFECTAKIEPRLMKPWNGGKFRCSRF